MAPVDQELLGEARLGLAHVLGDELAHHALPVLGRDPLVEHGIRVDVRGQRVLRIVHEGHAAGHAGGEVRADRPQDHRGAAGHVLAAVGAAALDHGEGVGIAHAEALAGLAGGEQAAGGRAVEHRVADNGVLFRGQWAGGHGAHHDGAAREALADVVVGVAEDLELEALHGEGAERLPGRAAQAHGDVPGLQAGHAEAPGDLGGQLGADRPLRVADRVLELQLLAHFEEALGVLDDLRVEGFGHLVAALKRAVDRVVAGIGARQQRIQVEVVEVGGTAADLHQQVGAPDDLVERARAQRGQNLAHLLGHEAEQIHHLLRRTGELLAQRRVLGADPDRAGVRVALAHHDAAHGDQGRGADAVLLGAQERGDDHVAPGADAAVGAQAQVLAQAVEGQHLMDLAEAHLPGHAGVLDRRLGAGAGAARVAGDQNHVGLGLGHAGGDRADARARHQFHADLGLRVDLLEVVDQLRQILDRIDVVVGRRRDQHDARRRVAQARDHLGHLEAGQLAALAGLGALGDLDLELAAVVEVLGRDPEAARGDLLDGRVLVVTVGPRHVALRVLAAFAGIRLGADPVHGDIQRAVRLGAERAQRHAGRDEALADLGDRFDLLDGHRRNAVGLEAEQVAQLRGRRAARAPVRLHVDRLGKFPVGRVGVGGHRLLEGVNEPGLPGMVLAAPAVAVEAADRQRHVVLAPGAGVQIEQLLLDAGQTDPGDPARHVGEVLVDQGARQADRLEVVAAAVGREHRDAHLGHDLEQAVVERRLVAPDTLLQRGLAEQAAAPAPGDRLLGQVGVDRGRPDADEDREIVHVEALAAAHVDRGEGPQALAHQVRVHRAGGQDHGDRRAAAVQPLVGQDQVLAALAHRGLGLAPDALDGVPQRVLRPARVAAAGIATGIAAGIAAGIKGAIDGNRGLAHEGAHGFELGVREHGRIEQQYAALVLVLGQDVTQVAEPGLERHDPALAQRIDGRVGNLAEVLPEEVMQAAVMVGEHGQRGVVAHGADRLLGVLDHGVEDELQVLHGHAEGQLPAAQLVALVEHRFAVVRSNQVVDLGRVADPLTEGTRRGQTVLELRVVVEPALLQVDRDHLAGPEAALFQDPAFVQADHAGLGAGEQQAVLGDRVA